jgi:hypothetical protein
MCFGGGKIDHREASGLESGARFGLVPKRATIRKTKSKSTVPRYQALRNLVNHKTGNNPESH